MTAKITKIVCKYYQLGLFSLRPRNSNFKLLNSNMKIVFYYKHFASSFSWLCPGIGLRLFKQFEEVFSILIPGEDLSEINVQN